MLHALVIRPHYSCPSPQALWPFLSTVTSYPFKLRALSSADTPSRSTPHDPTLIDLDDGVRCAMAFFDAEFGSWRIDLDKEVGEAVACWL